MLNVLKSAVVAEVCRDLLSVPEVGALETKWYCFHPASTAGVGVGVDVTPTGTGRATSHLFLSDFTFHPMLGSPQY